MLHITSGDSAGASISVSGIDGEVFVWHDILYDGPRNPGWPDNDTLKARALFLEGVTGGGLSREQIVDTLKKQYRKLATAADYERIVLWFDACLFDQSMLSHILTCLRRQEIQTVDLLCIDAFPGIELFDGLGQLSPQQLASLFNKRQPVTPEQFEFAVIVDRAFADQDIAELALLSAYQDAPLPWVPAAVARWLEEIPNPKTGLGRLEQLALDAIRGGCETPREIYADVSARDTHPQFWGDTMLWAKINGFADRRPPLVKIEGPKKRLPQWDSNVDLSCFRITCLLNHGREPT